MDFNPEGNLEIAGVAHQEFDGDSDTGYRAYTRWTYDGQAEFTLVALTSLERDRLFDELVRVIAFGQENTATSEFRAYIEENDLLGCHLNWDQISVSGTAATPGTPWATDEIIYETTISIRCHGEFLSDSVDGTLVPLSAVVVQEYTPDEVAPW